MLTGFTEIDEDGPLRKYPVYRRFLFVGFDFGRDAAGRPPAIG